MVVARFVVVKALSDFKEERLEWQKQKDDDTQSQVFLLTKVIKKEVFDLSDTMDVMAKVIRGQDDLLRKQDKRMALIE